MQDFGKTLTTKNAVKRNRSSDKLILGEQTTVYAGAGLVAAGIPFGTEMTVHTNLAKKLLASGKVSENKPAEQKEKTKKEEDKNK